ncbi:vitellogenin-like [Periplaneta americana]|uniref:vitellogenin-like n=1 Tax=Periplaneta americana TaxID=6978 RepID=UPI0037E82378
MEPTLTLVCLLLPAIITAEHGWKPRVEYTYSVDGRTVAGIESLPNQQHAGVHYRGKLRVQQDPTGSLLLKFQNMSYTNLHENLPDGWWAESNQVREKHKELPLTGSTVAVKFGPHGPVSLSMKSGLDDWEINFLQGMVNQLHIDTTKLKEKHKSKSKRSQLNTSYKLMEDSMFGRCEVLYEIARVPRAVALAQPHLFPSANTCDGLSFIEVFKTRNFSNCEYSATLHFGLPKSKDCPVGGAMCKQFWSRASVTRVAGCGEQGDMHVLQAETNSRVLVDLHLHSGSRASVSSYVALNLESTQPVSKRFSHPSNAVELSGLKHRHTEVDPLKEYCLTAEEREKLFSLETERKKKSKTPSVTTEATLTETPTTMDPNRTSSEISTSEKSQWDLGLLGLHSAPHQPLTPYALARRGYEGNLQSVQKVRELIAEAASDFEMSKTISEKMTLEKIMNAVRICRTMPLFDLKKIVGNVFFQTKNNLLLSESKLLRDVLVMCGTNPAFHVLRTWIEQKDLTGEAASEVVAALPEHLQTPSPDVVRHFYELVRSNAVKEDPQLRISAVLAFSHLLRVACVDVGLRRARYSEETLDARCDAQHVERYISWLAGLAQTDPLRRVYVAALGNTGVPKALATLRAVAEEPSASLQLRTAAVVAMKHPTLLAPDAAARTLFALYRDVGQPAAVRVAAVSLLLYARPSLVLLQRVAVLTWYDPSATVAAFVHSSLRALASLRDPVYSEVSRRAAAALPLARPAPLDLHLPQNFLWTRVNEELHTVILNHMSYEKGMDPFNIYFRHTQRLGGIFRVPLEVDLSVTNPEQLLTLMQEFILPSGNVTQARPAMDTLERSTRWIRHKLKIAERKLPPVQGDLRLQFGALVERIFPFDNKLPAMIDEAVHRLLATMEYGKDFHFQKVDETSLRMAVVTELGFPVNFELSVPWMTRATGNAKLNTGNQSLDLDIRMMYSAQLLSELSFFTKWDDTVHMAASHGVSFVRLPEVQATARIATPAVLQFALRTMRPEERVVLHHSSKPFTSQHSVFDLLPATHKYSASVVHNKKSTTKWKSPIPNVNINYTTEAPNRSPIKWLQESINIQGFYMMWPSIEANSLEVEIDALNSVTLNVSFAYREILGGAPAGEVSRFEECSEGDQRASQSGAASAKSSSDSDAVVTRPQNFWFGRLRLLEMSQQGAADNITTPTAPSVVAATPTTVVNEATTASYSDLPLTAPTTVRPPVKSAVLQHGIFNVTTVKPFMEGLNGSRHDYLLRQIFVGIPSGSALVIGLNMSVEGKETREIATFMSYAAGSSGKEKRFGFFLEDGDREVAVTSSLVSTVRPMIQLASAMRAQIRASWHADLMYVSPSSQFQMSLKTVMSQGNMKLNNLEDRGLADKCIERREGPETDISPECLNAAMEALFMNKYNVTLMYDQEGQFIKEFVRRYMTHLYIWLTPNVVEDVDDSTRKFTPANTIQGFFEITPQLDSINALIRTETQKLELAEIPVNPLVVGALRYHPALPYSKRLKGQAYCGHGGKKFRTFDGVEFDYELSSCWHLLAKDCSGNSRVAILIRSFDGNRTELELNLDNYQVVSLQPGPNVTVNQEPLRLEDNVVAEIADEDGTVVLQMVVSDEPEHIIVVEMPAHGFSLVYTGSSTLVLTDRGARGRLCGICGDLDGDIVRELRKPQDTLARSAQEFAASYALE